MTELDPLAPPRDQWPAVYTVERANRAAANRRRHIRTRTDRLVRHHRPKMHAPRQTSPRARRWVPMDEVPVALALGRVTAAIEVLDSLIARLAEARLETKDRDLQKYFDHTTKWLITNRKQHETNRDTIQAQEARP